MSTDKPYYIDNDGIYRIKPCRTMEVQGRIIGAGTIVKITEKQEKERENV